MHKPPWVDILHNCPKDKPIFLAGGCAEPTAALQYIGQNPDLFAHRTLVSGHIPQVNTVDPTCAAPDARLLSIFPCPSNANRALLPWTYSRLYDWLSGSGQIGLAICQVARTATGHLSLGLSADFMPALLGAHVPIIAQINPALPVAPGAPLVDERRFAATFEAVTSLPRFDDGVPDAITAQIGTRIAGLIRPGDTLQLGLGKVQAAILNALHADPRPFNLHGGMISAPALPLLDAGIVSHATAGVLLGDDTVYARAPSLDTLDLRPVDQTHGRRALAQFDALVTANAALSVDLAGQATCESIKGRQISAPGGLPDFHRAAMAAPQGRAILALRSVTKTGKSTIVVNHPEGTRISLNAQDADIVVTEHGTAHLRHLDEDARAAALIALAAPEHRAAFESMRRA